MNHKRLWIHLIHLIVLFVCTDLCLFKTADEARFQCFPENPFCDLPKTPLQIVKSLSLP